MKKILEDAYVKKILKSKTRRCRHERAHVVIWNPTTHDQQLSVTWCWRCGAIRRAFGIPDGRGGFVYTWAGGQPQWEHPHGVNGTKRNAGDGMTADEKKRKST